jgi:tetratricopeptide (TPR) repeat protein
MPTRRLILLSLGLSTVLVVVWGSGWLARDASRDAGRLDVRLTAEAAVPRDRAESSRSIAAATDERSPEALRRRGTLRLSHGRAAQAVQDLEQASSLKPRDARVASDLAAAYLARARERSDPFDLVLALAAADRALQMSPALPEARYNHALVLERLHLWDAARQAWEAYLDLDAMSDWSREARARHAALAGPSAGEEWTDQREWLDRATGTEEEIDRIAARFPQETRLYAEEDLLGSWAEAVKTGRSGDADRPLRRRTTPDAPSGGSRPPRTRARAAAGRASGRSPAVGRWTSSN